MIRLLLRLMLLLIMICGLAISAILLQPRNDAQMRAFFSPPQGCAAPCFLGIRPGVTSEAEALALLHAQPWIGQIVPENQGVSWSWNGQQPSFVSNYTTSLLLGRIDFRSGVVSQIRIATTTIWAEFYFLFGPPDRVIYATNSTPSLRYQVYDGAYTAPGFEVETETQCPVTSHEATWFSTVLITWPISGPALSDQTTGIC